MGRVPSHPNPSGLLAGTRFPLLPPSASSRECAGKCPAKQPLLSALGAHPAAGPCPLALNGSCGRHIRTSTLRASGMPFWDPRHTLQGSGIPVPSKEIFLPLKGKLSGRSQKPSAARSYSDISLPAFITSPMVVLAGGLGTKSGEGLWWELPWVQRDTERQTEQAKKGRRGRRTQI